MVGRKKTEETASEEFEETPQTTEAEEKSATPQDAPPLPPEAQPAGSGAVPGSQGAAEQTFGERLKAQTAGEQMQPGVNDGRDVVRYTGDSTIREITTEDWERFGVQDMPTVRWERRTGHVVPRETFTEQALNVLRQQEGFDVP